MRTTAGLLGEADLPAEDSWAEIAREYVRAALSTAGRRTVDDVVLLASEVFTNAVRHSESGRRPGGVVTLRVFEDGCKVRVEVVDEGAATSVPQIPAQAGPLSEDGRGLWLVRELSSAWG